MGPSHSDMTRPTKTGIPRSKGLSNYLESRWFLGIDGAILIGRVLLLYMIDLGRLANAIFIKQWQTVVKSIQRRRRPGWLKDSGIKYSKNAMSEFGSACDNMCTCLLSLKLGVRSPLAK
jgi:hypothetical protein